MSPRPRLGLLLLGCALLGLLSACSTERAQREQYDFQPLPQARWQPGARYAFPLLFTERDEALQTSLLLRLDSRLDRTEARLRTAFTWRGETLRADTFRLQLASAQGQWERPGIVYHDYELQLARPLQVVHTGLYQLEVTLLDSLPLAGVAQLGLHTLRDTPPARP